MGTRDELTRDEEGVRRGGLRYRLLKVNYNLLNIFYFLILSCYLLAIVFRLSSPSSFVYLFSSSSSWNSLLRACSRRI